MTGGSAATSTIVDAMNCIISCQAIPTEIRGNLFAD